MKYSLFEIIIMLLVGSAWTYYMYGQIRYYAVARKLGQHPTEPIYDEEKKVYVLFVKISEDGVVFPAFAVSTTNNYLTCELSIYSSRTYSYEAAVDEFLLTLKAWNDNNKPTASNEAGNQKVG